MINYGEPQILQLMKNTLPSRLYPLLFPIDNLRDAITTAKRMMIKEMIDRQKIGQTCTAPFMRVSDSNQSTIKASKRGVTFDAMETIERNSDSIDKLTLLVIKMNMKMDKREEPYKPNVYQGRPRGQCRNRQPNYPSCNRSSVVIEIGIEGITTTEIIIGPTIGIDLGTTIGMKIEEITIGLMINRTITDKTIGDIITNKTIEGITEIDKIIEEMTLNRGIGIGVRVDRDQELTIVTILGLEIEVEMDIYNREPEHYQMTETDHDLDLGPTLE